MTNLNVVLKSADEEERKFDTGDSILKKLLPELGYELYVGGNFNNKKNNFWYKSISKKYSIDPFHNILHIHGGYMATLENIINADPSIFESSLDEKHTRDNLLLDIARNLINYLDENLDLIATEKVQSVPILDIPIKEIRDDIVGLRRRVQALNSAGLGTGHYNKIAQELLVFYRGLKQKYMGHQQLLEEFSQTPHPPPQ
mgnify:CR=1 FL=1